jgi:heat shock protein HspQ
LILSGGASVGCCLWPGWTRVNSGAAFLPDTSRQCPREKSPPTRVVCLPNRRLGKKHLQNIAQIAAPAFWQAGKSHYISGAMNKTREAKFQIGQIVKHRIFPFRGVVFDIDPTFSNTEEWYQSIPVDVRPNKDQPFYHLYAENSESQYVAYVSEQNLLPDPSGDPVQHPQVAEVFKRDERGNYRLRRNRMH